MKKNTSIFNDVNTENITSKQIKTKELNSDNLDVYGNISGNNVYIENSLHTNTIKYNLIQLERI